ncbi:MAG: hypothetical protein HY751_03040 [Nitrospinae bacterium]|nr:hypothetical protein [Nitrospinota bacterium]
MPISGYTPNRALAKILQGSTDNWDAWLNQNFDTLDAPSLIYQITAAENLPAGQVAVIKDDGSGAKKAYLAASGAVTMGDPLGVVNETVSSNSPARLTLAGRVQDNGWNFGPADKHVYLSASGTVTTAQTTTKLGFALSSSAIFFNPQNPSGGSGGQTNTVTGANGVSNTGNNVDAVISPVYGATANTVCQGNDSRLHNQNTDLGTSAASFEINYTGNSARLLTTGLTANRDFTFPDGPTKLVGESVSASITAAHTFAPATAQAPFALGANAQGQLVTGLNADKLDGQDASAFAASTHNHDASYSVLSHNHTGTYEPANANIQSHITETANPHSVTASQVGNATAQWNADKIQGVSVVSTAPSDGQVLKYVSANSRYEPATVSGGGGGSSSGFGAFARLVIKNNATAPNSKVDITADAITLEDSAGAEVKMRAVSLTVDITVTGANGLDTGAESASAWYYLWAISNGTAVAGLFSISGSTPSMPSGYTYKRLLGAARNNASSNFLGFRQGGNNYYYNTPVTDLSAGTATTFTTVTPTLPPMSVAARFTLDGGTNNFSFSLDGSNASAYAYGINRAYQELPLNDAGQFYYKRDAGSGGMTIYTMGAALNL